ncbi:MAG: type II toxin-antitoxin system VapC family toxin [Clostridia bacterium]|uniref:PIN domain-containing protein n=1 Tax=Bianquea renquensis TaxID=2763661 RepID=A0A926DQK0_9FIRM|nr:PIN domain-containing protein [Bianquea renquensis]MBC8542171.1 PIN domain-containing protein [Bianquea renquensis]
MKVLIDTNSILDVLCSRREFLEDSVKIFKLCEIKKIDGCISALSIPNIVYIMRRELDAEKTRDILGKLSLIFTIADLRAEDLVRAAEMDFKDYEDALQSACATRIKANYIITRNIKDFANSKVAAIKPSELFDRLEFKFSE